MKRVMKSTLLALVLISAAVALAACGSESTTQTGQVDTGAMPPINSTNESQQQSATPPQLPEPTPTPEPDNPLIGRWRSDHGDLTFVFAADGTGTSIDRNWEEDFKWSTHDGRLIITVLRDDTNEYSITNRELLFIEGDYSFNSLNHGRITQNHARSFTRLGDGGQGIVGSWQSGGQHYIFNADGTGERGIGGVARLPQPFTWSVDDDAITILFERARNGHTDVFGIQGWHDEREWNAYYFITIGTLEFDQKMLGRVVGGEDFVLPTGLWTHVLVRYPPLYEHLEFNSDGTGIRYNDNEQNFTWSVDGGFLTIITEVVEAPVDYAVSDTTLTIFDGGANTFTRVGDGR
jgi:hypothetical protein